MTKPPYLCNCGLLIAHGNQCVCQAKASRERKARHDQKRPTARERGYDSKWDIERKIYLAANPYCRKCGTPATVVDHILPHKNDQNLFWNRSNWQPLCVHCHSSFKQRYERSKR